MASRKLFQPSSTQPPDASSVASNPKGSRLPTKSRLPSFVSKSQKPSNTQGEIPIALQLEPRLINIPKPRPQHPLRSPPTSTHTSATKLNIPTPSRTAPPMASTVAPQEVIRVQASIQEPESARSQSATQRNVLRRKPSVIGRYVSERRQRSAGVQPALPTSTSTTSFQSHQASESTDHQDYSRQRNVQVVTPLSNPSMTPSLTYSATPTSRTSHSPHADHHSPHFGPRPWTSAGKPSSQVVEPVPTPDSFVMLGNPMSHPFFRPSSTEKTSMLHRPKTSTGAVRAPQSTPLLGPPTDQNASTTSLSKRYEKIETPPELAHLLIDPPPKTTQKTAVPPRRPSRDGTPNLESQQGPFPIVQSNMTRLPSRDGSEQRRPSIASSHIASPQLGSDTSSFTSERQQSKLVRPKKMAKAQAQAIAEVSPRKAQMNATSASAQAQDRKDGAQKSSSRFGFLTRRNKTPTEKPANESPKKGPAAGTGHEGYRSQTARRTSSSSAGSAAYVASSAKRRSGASFGSGSSAKQENNLDDFLQQRLSPVFIRGDAASNTSSPVSASTSAEPDVFSTAFSSPRNVQTSGSSIESRGPLKSSKRLATLASTSTAQGPHQGSIILEEPENQKFRHIQPLKSTISDSDDSGYQYNKTKSLSKLQTSSSDSSERSAGNEEVKAKSKKGGWSIFPKSNHSKSDVSKLDTTSKDLSTVSLASPNSADDIVPHTLAPKKSFAHYELFSTGSPIAYEELESIMQEADAAYLDGRSNSPASSRNAHVDLTAVINALRSNDQSPVLRSSSVYSQTPTLPQLSSFPGAAGPEPENINAASNPARQSRLPQVGRIPKVVSKRDHSRKLPEKSFSRPFADSRPKPTSDGVPGQSLADLVPAPLSAAALYSDTSRPGAYDFFSFPARKNSELSNSSNSSNIMLPSLPWVATERPAGTPLSEDEIWNEYDEFLDNVLTPSVSKSSSNANLAQLQSRDKDKRRTSPLKNSIDAEQNMLSGQFLNVDPLKLMHMPSLTSTLSSSRLTNSHEQASAVTSPSISKFVAGYADRNRDSTGLKSQSSFGKMDPLPPAPYSPSIYSIRDSAVLKHKRSTSLPQNVLRNSGGSGNSTGASSRNSQPMKLPDPQSMANLRFGALMVSKWLSFGRVLFSPVHFDMDSQSDHRVLVIDGLGTDWSYYCALTYSNAQVYCIGPVAAGDGKSNRNSLGGFQSLPNHRFVAHESLTKDLPFPQNFFSVVVFRFPSAISESALKMALQEGKRVLRPGGYIEMSALDLDLTNMGHVCRKTVRHLKMRLTGADPEVSLKPASDNIQYQLGRRGFENLSRCVVAVPASGTVSDSRENSSDGRDMSITELMKDQSPEGDTHITKMVARVGRWWYTRCYEMQVLPNGDMSNSVWTNEDLLKECEEHSTAFKLLICYAQKPFVNKRRTQSF